MNLVNALTNFLKKYQDFEGNIGNEIRTILEEMENSNFAVNEHYQANKLPVCQYLPGIIKNLNDNKTATQIQAILANKDNLNWVYGYDTDDMTESLTKNFAYAELMGSEGSYLANNFTIGLVLLGPNTFYPSHYHSTREIYFLLYGKAHWYYKNNFLGLKKEGELIYHDTNAIHAMKTFESPMLSLFTWTGDNSKKSKFFNKALEQ